MRRTLAVLAMTVFPFAAEAVSFQIKNCAAYAITVAAVPMGRGNVETQAHLTSGNSATLSCTADDCWLRVTYIPNPPQGVFADFPNPVRDDRCTRGTQDIALGDLPITGNCGC